MASLCKTGQGDYAASPTLDIFSPSERKLIRELESQEHVIECKKGASCETPLYFGFFFDGTKNNYVQNEAPKSQSNVARLYDTFPGESVPGVLPDTTKWSVDSNKYKHFFRVYAPGVASPFKEVSFAGDGKPGAVAGAGGAERIIWMLLQAINNVHRYFVNEPLVSPDEAKTIVRKLVLNRDSLEAMRPLGYFEGLLRKEDKNDIKPRLEFERLLLRLHHAIRLHMVNNKDRKPKKIEPGIVTDIRVSVFGFSRGATQARAFANWFKALCVLDASLTGSTNEMTLGSFPVNFDFLGLFDTVASVGLGNTGGNSLLGRAFDGHGAYADSEKSLRIPAGIKKCVHLIAAHEIRRSFPVDSISVAGTLPPSCEEIVFPGVHSDVGCGYSPGEQGRGTDPGGSDMLARVPLITMYKAAKLAGVPLHLDIAPERVQKKFYLSKQVVNALNAYIANCKVKSGTLTEIMREQSKLHILWHRNRLSNAAVPMDKTASFMRASNFDKNDLHSAHIEMLEEVKLFEEWRKKKGGNFKPTQQEPGFDDEHENEWEEISTWWDKEKTAPDAVLTFFDDYVHDSRAWFKLGPADNEEDLHKELKEMLKRHQAAKQMNAHLKKQWEANAKRPPTLFGRRTGPVAPYREPHNDFTEDQRRALDEYERTGQIPRMVNSGREPYSIYGIGVRAGYLRYRKVYAGGDSVLISQSAPDTESETATV